MRPVLSLCNFLGSCPHRHSGSHLTTVGVPGQPAGRGESGEGSLIHTSSRCGPEVARLPATHIPLASPCCQAGGRSVVPGPVCVRMCVCARPKGGNKSCEGWLVVSSVGRYHQASAPEEEKDSPRRRILPKPRSRSEKAAEPQEHASAASAAATGMEFRPPTNVRVGRRGHPECQPARGCRPSTPQPQAGG